MGKRIWFFTSFIFYFILFSFFRKQRIILNTCALLIYMYVNQLLGDWAEPKSLQIKNILFYDSLCHSVGISIVESWAMQEILPEWQRWVFFAILFFGSWNFITPCCHSVEIWIVEGWAMQEILLEWQALLFFCHSFFQSAVFFLLSLSSRRNLNSWWQGRLHLRRKLPPFRVGEEKLFCEKKSNFF